MDNAQDKFLRQTNFWFQAKKFIQIKNTSNCILLLDIRIHKVHHILPSLVIYANVSNWWLIFRIEIYIPNLLYTFLLNLNRLLLLCIYLPSQHFNVGSTLFQRWDQRWNNVDPTFKMKQNPTSDFQRCTTLIQRRCPTSKQRWNQWKNQWMGLVTSTDV